VQDRYLWGQAVDQILAQEDATNGVLWAQTDHLGSVTAWRNNTTGAIVDSAKYDSFGKRIGAPAVDTVFGWTGKYRDPLTGFQYNNLRQPPIAALLQRRSTPEPNLLRVSSSIGGANQLSLSMEDSKGRTAVGDSFGNLLGTYFADFWP
jgi:hypothetical protein